MKLWPRRRQTVRVIVTCLEDEPCDVAFEPEGAVHTLRPDDVFTVEFTGPGDGLVEVSHRSDGISIAGWGGAEVTAKDRSGRHLQL